VKHPAAVIIYAAMACAGAGAVELAVNAYNPFPIGSPRVQGMAGAFTGIASGAEALLANPASVVESSGFGLGNSEWDYMLAYTRQDEGFHSDFGNVGPSLLGSEGVWIASAGVKARFERAERCPLAYGFYILGESYSFTDGTGGTAQLNLVSPRLTWGRTYLDDRFAMSIGLVIPSPNFTYLPPGETELLDLEYEGMGGIPFEIGMLWKLPESNWHLGARLSGPLAARLVGEPVPSIEPFPTTVYYPGEFSMGAAWFWGGEAPKDRGEWFKRGIIDFDIRGVFPRSGTTGFERFRSASPLEIKDSWLLQPAVGVEFEVFSHAAWLWLGIYREPARYDDVDARTHVTGGFKVRLLKINKLLIYLNASSDAAERFHVWSASLTIGMADY